MNSDTRCAPKVVVVLEVLGTRVQQNPAHQSTKTSRNANTTTSKNQRKHDRSIEGKQFYLSVYPELLYFV
jgi:hypothetical protein